MPPTPREIWSAGDWPELAKMVAGPGEETARRAGAGPGVKLLDVGAGNGNVAIPAARAGAEVTALDPTPELFESGRERAAEAGVEVEWVVGDAMDLPYEDGSFDVVTSNFGAIFAPDHARAASELSRVARDRVVMTTWDLQSMIGGTFIAIAPFMPPPPPDFQPPPLWGVDEHVHEMFAPTGRSVTIERDTAPTPEFASADDYADFNMRVLGPLDFNRARLEEEGRWEELRGVLREHFAKFNESTDGTFRAAPVYLRVVVE